MKKHRNSGYERFQIKVGGINHHDDIDRIFAIREILETHDILTCDANGGWTKW